MRRRTIDEQQSYCTGMRTALNAFEQHGLEGGKQIITSALQILEADLGPDPAFDDNRPDVETRKRHGMSV